MIELEWRRADPADNTAKLFRHLDSGAIEREQVRVVQVFTEYYDLARGGVSSKRQNAEFVGGVAADATPQLSSHPVEFEIDPPKRGGEWPDNWHSKADEIVSDIAALASVG